MEARVTYRQDSVEGKVLENDPEALGVMIRWISGTLTWRRFWALRPEWKDLQQEVVLHVIESLRAGRFDPARDFRKYVEAVARYTAREAWVRRMRRAELTGLEQRDTAPVAGAPGSRGPFEDAERTLTRNQLVRWILSAASEECRRLIRAYFLDEQKYAEIASHLKVPVGTVKSRLFRCLRMAQELLGRRIPGLPAQDTGS
jgi:RNA polymerase sigma factor (sigma-70 family)